MHSQMEKGILAAWHRAGTPRASLGRAWRGGGCAGGCGMRPEAERSEAVLPVSHCRAGVGQQRGVVVKGLLCLCPAFRLGLSSSVCCSHPAWLGMAVVWLAWPHVCPSSSMEALHAGRSRGGSRRVLSANVGKENIYAVPRAEKGDSACWHKTAEVIADVVQFPTSLQAACVLCFCAYCSCILNHSCWVLVHAQWQHLGLELPELGRLPCHCESTRTFAHSFSASLLQANVVCVVYDVTKEATIEKVTCPLWEP